MTKWIRPTLKGFLISPTIPSEREGFTVECTYCGCRQTIGVSVADWIYAAINGDVQCHGLALLER